MKILLSAIAVLAMIGASSSGYAGVRSTDDGLKSSKPAKVEFIQIQYGRW